MPKQLYSMYQELAGLLLS